jgi:hypothetical protein
MTVPVRDRLWNIGGIPTLLGMWIFNLGAPLIVLLPSVFVILYCYDQLFQRFVGRLENRNFRVLLLFVGQIVFWSLVITWKFLQLRQ